MTDEETKRFKEIVRDSGGDWSLVVAPDVKVPEPLAAVTRESQFLEPGSVVVLNNRRMRENQLFALAPLPKLDFQVDVGLDILSRYFRGDRR